jgi:hypothetical protein
MKYILPLLLISLIVQSCFNSKQDDKRQKSSEPYVKPFEGIQLRVTEELKKIYESDMYVGGDYHPDATVRIFLEGAILRSKNGFDQDTLAVLKRNTKVTMIESAGQDSLNGLISNWHKVAVNEQTGYLWGPDIAIVSLDLTSEDTSYSLLYGLTGIEQNFTHTGEVLLVKGDSIIQRLDVKPIEMVEGINTVYGYDVNGIIYENPGFTGVKNLVGLHGSYGACGYDGGYVAMLWDGNKLHKGPAILGMGDADVSYKAPYAYYPKDSSGLKDKLVLKVLYGEAKENSSDYEEEVETFVYKWIPGVGLKEEK